MSEIAAKIVPCLWFDTQAEEAASFYVSIFKNASINSISHYSKEGFEIHGMPEGTVLTVEFEIEGQSFTAMNGGPTFKFNEAVSFQVLCETREELDHYWEKLTEGGDPEAQQCGWLKDRYGVSWQIVSREVYKYVMGSDQARADRAMRAMLQMKKLDIEALRRAYEEG